MCEEMEIYRVRGRESKTGTTSPSVAQANPQSAPFSSSSVTRHLFYCLGFGFKGRLGCGEKGTQREHGGNGDALRRGAADSSAPMAVWGVHSLATLSEIPGFREKWFVSHTAFFTPKGKPTA